MEFAREIQINYILENLIIHDFIYFVPINLFIPLIALVFPNPPSWNLKRMLNSFWLSEAKRRVRPPAKSSAT